MLLWCLVALLASRAAGVGDSTAADAALEVQRAQLEVTGGADNTPTHPHRLTAQQQQHQTTDQQLQLLQQQQETTNQRLQLLLRRLEINHQRLQQQLETTDEQLQKQQQTIDQRLQKQQETIDQHLEKQQQTIDQRLQKQQQTIDQRLQRLQTRVDAADALVRDCSDLPAGTPRGVHVLRPDLQTGVPALCDDGWTVLQRRADILPRRDFYRGWQQYKWGFGSLAGEFWWGLQHVWRLTATLDRQYELRIELDDFEGNRRHALYQGFQIGPQRDGYRLTVVNYTGNAGDSLSYHSGQRFSTKDKDQDDAKANCAQMCRGGWWYKKCYYSNLNGLYLSGKHSRGPIGIIWGSFRSGNYSLKTVEMKIRPIVKLSSE